MHRKIVLLVLAILSGAICARCDNLAYIASPDQGVVLKVNLTRQVVESTIRVGEHPWYISVGGNKLFIHGMSDSNDSAYIQVFDLRQGRSIKRIETGSICCSVAIGDQMVFAVVKPKPELIVVDPATLSFDSIPLPKDFSPTALSKGRDAGQLLVVASHFASLGVPDHTVCHVVSIPQKKVISTFDLPLGIDSILLLRDAIILHAEGPTGSTNFFYGDRLDGGNWTRKEIPFFCEDYTNRQKYAVLPKASYAVYAAGDCPGDEELEANEPTILVLDSTATPLWKVTDKFDKIPAPNSIAILPDDRIVFVSGGFGLGILDPHTHKLLAHIRIGQEWALWGLALVPD